MNAVVVGASAAFESGHELLPARDRYDFVVFLDESGTHAASALTSVGAVEIGNLKLVEANMERLKQRALASAFLWQGSDAKRHAFADRGFHYTEDSASVQALLVEAFREVPFRSSVYFSRRTVELSTPDLLTVMYVVMVRTFMQKHRALRVAYVFEENQELNALYSRIVASVCEELEVDPVSHSAFIASKPSAGLSLVDYVLGITTVRLENHLGLTSEPPPPFKLAHYDALIHRMSHLLDFDSGHHRSGYREIMLESAPPRSSTFGSE